MPTQNIYHKTDPAPFQSIMSTQLKQRLEYGLRELSEVVEIHSEIRGGVPVLKGYPLPKFWPNWERI